MASPTLVHIRRGARWRALGFGDIWDYRGLLVSLGFRDIKLRQKQTILGLGWVVLQPVLSAGVLTAVFGLIVDVPTPGGVPFFVFAYMGQMAWSLFSGTLSRTSGSLVGNIVLVMKIYFPRPILPFASIIAGLVDFAISFVIAIPMLLYYSAGVHLGVALLAGASMVLLATGVGFLFSATSVRFRDVLFGLPFLLQLGLYACPVAYGLDVARDNLSSHAPWYFTVYMLNPLAALIEAFRWGLLGQGVLMPGYIAYGVVVAIVMFVVGFVAFRSAEGRFADVI